MSEDKKELTSTQIMRQDEVDNDIFRCVNGLLPADKQMPWDMEWIGELRDKIYREVRRHHPDYQLMDFYPFIYEERTESLTLDCSEWVAIVNELARRHNDMHVTLRHMISDAMNDAQATAGNITPEEFDFDLNATVTFKTNNEGQAQLSFVNQVRRMLAPKNQK